MTRIRLFAALLAIALVASACGDDDASTTAPTGATTTTASGTTTTGGDSTTSSPPTTEPGGTVEDPIDLDDVTLYREPADTSYRVTLIFHFRAETDDDVIEGTQIVEGGKLLDPTRYEITGRAEGDATGPQCFEFHNLPGFVDAYDTYLDEGGMLTGEAHLIESGIEVNGRLVNRYAITIDNIDPTDGAGSEVDELTEAYIDIDAQNRTVVQLVLVGRGRSALLTGQPNLVGDIDYSLNFSEFGTIESLEPPDGC